MAEERRQNIFIVMATDGASVRMKDVDCSTDYPVASECITTKYGTIPYMMLVRLGSNALTVEECDECVADISSALKSLGCKMTGDIDLHYCSFDVNGGERQTIVEAIISYQLTVNS